MKYKVTLNKKVYEVEVEKGEAILVDEYEAMAPAPSAPVAAAPVAPAPAAQVPAAPVVTAAGETITAPLPGSIFKVMVQNGEAVKEGQVLVIIEAMKMENEVLAPRAGTVARWLRP